MNSELGAIEERIRRLEKFVIGQNLDRREDDEKVFVHYYSFIVRIIIHAFVIRFLAS